MDKDKAFAVVERIKSYAKLKGISLSRLEASIGKKNSYLANVKNPTAEVLIKLCEQYSDITPGWLLLGIEDSKSEEDKAKIEYLQKRLMEANEKIEQLLFEIHVLNQKNNA